jgi:hypothetical protein
MAETAALLADDVPPGRPLRRWVLSLPHALRFLLATDPDALTRVLGVAYRTITGHLLRAAGLARTTGQTGAGRCVPGFRSAALEGRTRGEARTRTVLARPGSLNFLSA